MKFPQILMLLAILCMILFSCREPNPKKETPIENSIPSAEEHHNDTSSPKKTYPKPKEISRDSILKKQRKSKDLDTLKPKVAMLS
ncbi:MAG: hypothetical protein WBM53_14980 [Maribacter sp.]